MPNGRPKIWRSVDTSSDDHHHDYADDDDDAYDAYYADNDDDSYDADDYEHIKVDSRNELMEFWWKYEC